MLPKKIELEKMVKIGKKVATKEERKLAREEQAEKKKESTEKRKKFEEDVTNRMQYIENDILYEIKRGKRKSEFHFGDGRHPDPIWEEAVKRLRKENKDYELNIKAISVRCDNHFEAYNTDYCEPREWFESRWELTISW